MTGAGTTRPTRRFHAVLEPLPDDSLGRIETAAFDLAVVLAVAGVPVAMGGRHPIGQAVLTAAALAATASWTIRSWRTDATWRVGVVEALAAAGLAVCSLQLLALPGGLIEAVAPRLRAILPCLDGGRVGLGGWHTLSLVPGETIACLQILLAQAVLAMVLAQRLRDPRAAERVLATAAWATVLIAAVGIVQYLAGTGRYLWIYEFVHNDAGGAVKGTFTNRNHFAGFMAIGCGTVLARTIAPPERHDAAGAGHARLGGWLLLAVVGFATVSSLSRGGSLAAAVAILVCFACLAGTARRRTTALVGLASATMLAAAALWIHGWDRFAGRLESLQGQRTASVSWRYEVWRAACRTIAEFPLFGTGAGSHADVAPRVMPPTGEIVFTHAENSFLTIGVETGMVGLVVAVTAAAVAIAAGLSLVARGDGRERRIGAAAAAGLAAGVVHALVDFTWHVPACSTLLITLGTAAVAVSQARTGGLPSIELRLGRPAAVLAGVGVALLLAGGATRQLAAARAERCWERSVRLARQIEDAQPASAARGATATRDDPDRLLVALDDRIVELERCATARPDHPRARAALAIARLERFGRRRAAEGKSLGLMDIRLAAGKGGFASHAELVAWVRRATAPHSADLELAIADAVQAIRISPLAGEAWCGLAQLAFLAGRPETAPALVAQALAVRPFDSLVLLEAANQALLDGDPGRAAELWRASFAADTRQRTRIVGLLVPRLSSADACDLLAPDLDGLRAIEAAWTAREQPDELTAVRELRLSAVLAEARQATTGPRAACGLFLEAASIERRLGRLADARATLASAIRVDPSSYEAHRAAADAAATAEDWPAAIRELEWCLLRRPDSRDLRETMGRLRARRDLDATGSAAVPAAPNRL